MRKIEIKRISIKNFKGIREMAVPFFESTEISGKNASGKTTIFDALTWVLFNKDSDGNEKFAIRPLNADGTTVDGVEIEVTALFAVDGKEIELHKTQKQNWVKKRGTETAVFQGNVNEYEVDGYPKGEKEYKEVVSGLIDEGLFKILTNPMYFPNMKWQEQRAMLMSFLTDKPDAELAKEIGGLDALIPELEKAPSTEDIRNKYAKALKGLKERQKEIPVRIDELEATKVIVDVEALKAEKAEIVQIIAKTKAEEEEAEKQMRSFKAVKDDIYDLKLAAHEIERSVSDRNREAKYTADVENRKLEIAKENAKTEIKRAQNIRDEYETHVHNIEKGLKLAKEKEFTGATSCPTCGRPFDEEHLEEAKERFSVKKQAEIENLESSLKEAKSELNKANKRFHDAVKKSNEMAELHPITPIALEDYTKLPEWLEIKEQVKAKEELLATEESVVWQIENFSNIRRSHEARVAEINEELAKADAMSRIDDRIAELRSELAEVGQKVSDQERMLYLLEQFIQKKLDLMSEEVNGKFDGVEWSLFEKQINGGVKETCVCTVNGVPYGSVNSGHKIVAGLQIIKALQKRYGVCAPIFIDNAESINRVNVPVMDNQMIYLTVTDGDLEVR